MGPALRLHGRRPWRWPRSGCHLQPRSVNLHCSGSRRSPAEQESRVWRAPAPSNMTPAPACRAGSAPRPRFSDAASRSANPQADLIGGIAVNLRVRHRTHRQETTLETPDRSADTRLHPPDRHPQMSPDQHRSTQADKQYICYEEFTLEPLPGNTFGEF